MSRWEFGGVFTAIGGAGSYGNPANEQTTRPNGGTVTSNAAGCMAGFTPSVVHGSDHDRMLSMCSRVTRFPSNDSPLTQENQARYRLAETATPGLLGAKCLAGVQGRTAWYVGEGKRDDVCSAVEGAMLDAMLVGECAVTAEGPTEQESRWASMRSGSYAAFKRK